METSTGTHPLLVSIIITSHNYAAYLARAIGSALGQTWPAIEVIVIDDGSDDSSPEIIRSFGDRVVAVFKERGGQCSCINVGFSKARGEVIIFLDADDVLLPDAAALHAEQFAEPNTDTIKACGYMDVIEEDGSPTGHRIPAQLPESGDYREATLQEGLDTIQTSFTSGHAWARSFLSKVLPVPEDGLIGPDGYLTSIDRLFGRIAFIHKPVVQYRRHSRNKGPIRYRFDLDYMKDRVARKQHRIQFAEQWVARLGYKINTKKFRTIRDWRLLLMNHILWLEGEATAKTPLLEFVTTPFRNKRRNLLRSIRISLALLSVRLMPKNSALEMSRRLLEKAFITNRYGRTVETGTA